MPDFMDNEIPTACIMLFLSNELKARIGQAIGQEVPEDAHLTVAYLGPVDLLHSVDALKVMFEEFVSYHSIVNGSIGGVGQFLSEDGTDTSEVLLFNGSDIEKFRYHLINHLSDYGFSVNKTYGFIPHITISTNSKELTLTEPIKNVSLGTLSLVIGDNVFSADLPGLRMGKAGARTNRKDKKDVQQGHDIFVNLGAMCKADHLEKPKKNVTDDFPIRLESTGSLMVAPQGESKNNLPISITNTNIKEFADVIAKSIREVTEPTIQLSQTILDLPVSNAFKTISKTSTELIVGNHIFLYGSAQQRDLEGIASNAVNKDGSRGEFFTKRTEYVSDFTEVVGRLPVDFEHGGKPGGKNDPGRNNILGYVNWETVKATPDGLWVERILDRGNEYVKLLEPLIEAGLIGSSSEPVQEGIRKAANGEILQWPLFRDAITITPMEPRMVGQNSLSVESKALLKSFYKSVKPDNAKIELELFQLNLKSRKISNEV